MNVQTFLLTTCNCHIFKYLKINIITHMHTYKPTISSRYCERNRFMKKMCVRQHNTSMACFRFKIYRLTYTHTHTYSSSIPPIKQNVQSAFEKTNDICKFVSPNPKYEYDYTLSFSIWTFIHSWNNLLFVVNPVCYRDQKLVVVVIIISIVVVRYVAGDE